MLLSLLSCSLFSVDASQAAQPVLVPLPTASHAGSVPARELLWPTRTAEGRSAVDADQAYALCPWLTGASDDAGLATSMLRKGQLEFAVLEVDATSVRFAGEEIVALQGGLVDDINLRGQMISPMYDALVDRVTDRKMLDDVCTAGAPATDWLQGESVLLAIAPGMPFKTVREVMYTAGQAQIGTHHLAVSGTAGAAAPSGEPPQTDRLVTVVFEDAGRTFIREETRLESQAGPLAPHLPALLDDGPLGCGIVVPQTTTAWSDVIATFDELSASGARRYVIAGGVATGGEEPTPEPIPATVAAASLSLTLDTVVPVFTAHLPTIGPPTDEVFPECAMRAQRVEVSREVAIEGGVLGALSDADMENLGGLIGAKGTQIGSGGLGFEGAGIGGGPAEGLGGLGTTGSGVTTAEGAMASLGEPTIDGPLRIDLLNAVVKRHLNQVRYCYQREFVKDASLSGTVTIRFVVASDGSVSSAEVADSTLASDKVADCVAGRFMRFKFPELPAGMTATVEQPFTFSSN